MTCRPLPLLALSGVLVLVTFQALLHAEPGTARIRWDGGLDRLGHQAEKLVAPIQRQVSARLGWAYDGPEVDVVLVRGHARMNEVAGQGVPTWAVGVALAHPPRIVIRADLLERGYGSGLEQVLRHEWVHVSWRWRAGPRHRQLPLWFEEGLAETIGGGISVDAGAALDIAAAFGHLLAFQDLERRFPGGAKQAGLAYKQGRSWVAYLLDHKGWGAVQGILDDIASGEAEAKRQGRDPFAETVRRRTGTTLGEWHAGWQLALEEDARPWFHLLFQDISNFLLMAAALVAFVAFFGLVRRRRRQIRRLPDVPWDPPTD